MRVGRGGVWSPGDAAPQPGGDVMMHVVVFGAAVLVQHERLPRHLVHHRRDVRVVQQEAPRCLCEMISLSTRVWCCAGPRAGRGVGDDMDGYGTQGFVSLYAQLTKRQRQRS
jgi:hypothetical protein